MVGGKYTNPVKTLHLHYCMTHFFLTSTGRHLLGVSFITSLKSNLCRALTKKNTTENNCIISQAENAAALQPNVFLTGTRDTPLPRSTANSSQYQQNA
jgi:hypothetical protein